MTHKNTFNFDNGEAKIRVDVNLYGTLLQIKIKRESSERFNSRTAFTNDIDATAQIGEFLSRYLWEGHEKEVTDYIESITNLKF